MPVLTDAADRARLRPLVAALFVKANLVAHGERSFVEHAVAMKVELPFVGLDIPPFTFGVEIRHAAVFGRDVELHVLALQARMIFELTACRAKRIADRDVHVEASAVERVIAANNYVGAWHGDRDAHANRIALVLVLMRAFDEHLAALDARIDVLQLDRPVAHERFERWRRVEIAKCNFQWNRHDQSALHGARRPHELASLGYRRADSGIRARRASFATYAWFRIAGSRFAPSLRMSTTPAPQRATADTTRIADVMCRDVVTVRADLGLETLTKLLLDRQLSRVPVVDEDGHLIGMVSKTDLVREHELRGDTEVSQQGGEETGRHVHEVDALVRDVMTGLPFALPWDTTLRDAARRMLAQGVHAVPVTSSDGTVIGMLSAIDVVAWVAGRRA